MRDDCLIFHFGLCNDGEMHCYFARRRRVVMLFQTRTGDETDESSEFFGSSADQGGQIMQALRNDSIRDATYACNSIPWSLHRALEV